MIVTRKEHPKETDLLIGREHSRLVIKGLEDNVIETIQPSEPWTHEALEMFDYDTIAPFGWNAYLASNWIGSSEV